MKAPTVEHCVPHAFPKARRALREEKKILCYFKFAVDHKRTPRQSLKLKISAPQSSNHKGVVIEKNKFMNVRPGNT